MRARSNGQIENYECCCKTGQLRILRQNSNLIVFLLPGSYHKVFCDDKSYGQIYKPRTIKKCVSTSTIHKAMEKRVPNTRRSKVHEANAKISTIIWISSSNIKRIHPTRFLGELTSLSTINDDAIQPSRKLQPEVSDPNLS